MHLDHPATNAKDSPLRLHPVARRLLLLCSTALLIMLAWGAFSGALGQFPRSHTVGQRVETTVQLVCGFLSLATVVTCFWWRQWDGPVRWAWAISLATAVALSSLVWGPPMPLTGLLFAVGTLLAALAIIWALRTTLAPMPVRHSIAPEPLNGRPG